MIVLTNGVQKKTSWGTRKCIRCQDKECRSWQLV